MEKLRYLNLVCGGNDGNRPLSSCEINAAGEKSWSSMTSLPEARYIPTALTINNRVLLIGKPLFSNTEYFVYYISQGGSYDGDFSHNSNEIFELDLETEQWSVVGNLFDARRYFAASVINEDLWQYCID